MIKSLSRKKHGRTKKHRHNKSCKRLGKHKINKSRKMKVYRGGFGPGAGPVGYPLVYGNVSSWPGVSGNDQGMGNHYELSKVGIPSGPFDPPMSSREIAQPFSSSFKYGGSSRRRNTQRRGHLRKRRYRGGGLLPQDLVNLGRSVGYGLSSSVSNFFGSVNHPVNPLPTESQGIDKDYKIIQSKIPNLHNISKNSYNEVASI